MTVNEEKKNPFDMCKIQPPLNQPPDYQFARLSSTDIRVCIDSKLYSKKKENPVDENESPPKNSFAPDC